MLWVPILYSGLNGVVATLLTNPMIETGTGLVIALYILITFGRCIGSGAHCTIGL